MALIWVDREALLLAAFGSVVKSYRAPLLDPSRARGNGLLPPPPPPAEGKSPGSSSCSIGVAELAMYHGHAFKVDAMRAVGWALVSASRSEVVLHNIKTGEPLWHFDSCALAERFGVTALAVSERSVYVGCEDGGLRALNLDTGALLMTETGAAWVGRGGAGSGPLCRLVSAVDARRGGTTSVVGATTICTMWSEREASRLPDHRRRGPPADDACAVNVSSTVCAVLLLPASSRGPCVAVIASDDFALHCLRVPTGEVAWHADLSAAKRRDGGGTGGCGGGQATATDDAPAVLLALGDDGVVFFVGVASEVAIVARINDCDARGGGPKATRDPAWVAPLRDAVWPVPLSLVGNSAWACSAWGDGKVRVCRASDGVHVATLWCNALLQRTITALCLAGPHALVVSSEQSSFVACWRLDLPGVLQPTSSVSAAASCAPGAGGEVQLGGAAPGPPPRGTDAVLVAPSPADCAAAVALIEGWVEAWDELPAPPFTYTLLLAGGGGGGAEQRWSLLADVSHSGAPVAVASTPPVTVGGLLVVNSTGIPVPQGADSATSSALSSSVHAAAPTPAGTVSAPPSAAAVLRARHADLLTPLHWYISDRPVRVCSMLVRTASPGLIVGTSPSSHVSGLARSLLDPSAGAAHVTLTLHERREVPSGVAAALGAAGPLHNKEFMLYHCGEDERIAAVSNEFGCFAFEVEASAAVHGGSGGAPAGPAPRVLTAVAHERALWLCRGAAGPAGAKPDEVRATASGGCAWGSAAAAAGAATASDDKIVSVAVAIGDGVAAIVLGTLRGFVFRFVGSPSGLQSDDAWECAFRRKAHVTRANVAACTDGLCAAHVLERVRVRVCACAIVFVRMMHTSLMCT